MVRRPTDQAYQNSVNVAATITGLVSATQGAVQHRSSAFMQGGNQIGSAPDLKGSIDQNTPSADPDRADRERMTGVVNTAVTATTRPISTVSRGASAAANAMTYRPFNATKPPGWGRTMIGRLALAIGVVVSRGLWTQAPQSALRTGDAQPLSALIVSILPEALGALIPHGTECGPLRPL